MSVKPGAKTFGRHFSKHKLASAVALALLSGTAFAAPQGGHVVGGSGSIDQAGNTTTVTQETDLLSIDWDSFDISADELIEFLQPGQDSVALNRILSSNGSEILGQINANGYVVLVNPNGIVFGEGSSVNAGGLIASGLQIDPEDFLNGDWVFKGLEGTDGTVVNAGFLNAATGGNIALVGKQVQNDGLIMARLGRVNLAAGNEAVLTFDASGLLGVQIDEDVLASELGESGAVINNGKIVAEQGQILLNASTAKDVFSNVVNRGEQRQAQSVVHHDDGSFTLSGGRGVVNTGELDVSGRNGAGDVVVLGKTVDHSGSIKANVEDGVAGHIELNASDTTELTSNAKIQSNAEMSGTGGVIKLLGKNVGLLGDSEVSATGYHGGGEVFVGGGLTGKDPLLPNSQFVYQGENAAVDASALVDGNGGEIILFAEKALRLYGSVLSKGGIIDGDGGFVETSGLEELEVLQAPSLKSFKGRGGRWLIDPYDISITDRFDSPRVDEDGDIYTSVGGNAFLSRDTLQTALQRGAEVIVQTGEGGSQEGNITLSAALNLNLDSADEPRLTLLAHNNINFENSITFSEGSEGKLNLNLTANRSGGEGNINFANNITIETNGGDLIIGSEETAGAFDVDFNEAIIDLTAPDYDDLQYLAPSGRIFVHAENDITTQPITELGSNPYLRVKGTERQDDLPKIDLLADNDIVFNGWRYDNNATETAEDGYLDPGNDNDSNNDGYTTLRLRAGGDVHINDVIEPAYQGSSNLEVSLRQQDRLNIILEANRNAEEGQVYLGADDGNDNITINTGGGNFTVENTNRMYFRGDTIDTSSPFGAGTISITSERDIYVGTVTFDYTGPVNTNNTTPLRVGHLNLTAGDDVLLDGIDVNGMASGVEYSEDLLPPSITLIADDRIEFEGGLGIDDSDTGGAIADTVNIRIIAANNGDGADDNGVLNINQTIFSGGGDIELSARTINFTNDADINASVFSSGGEVATDQTGAVTLNASETLTLNSVTTGATCDGVEGCGRLLISPRDIDSGSINIQQNTDTALNTHGRAIVQSGTEGDIGLTNPTNHFAGGVVFGVSNNVTLDMGEGRDGQDYAVAGRVVDEQVTAIAGDLTLRVHDDNNLVNDGSLQVQGATELVADGNTITLDNLENDFVGAVRIGTSGDEENPNDYPTAVTLADQNALILGATGNTSTVNGDLTVSAGGDVTQVGALQVTDNAQFATEGNALILDEENLLNTLQVDGNVSDATIHNAQDLTVDGFTATEALTFNIQGDLTQTTENAAALVTPALTINAGAANLGHESNAIGALNGEVGQLVLSNNSDLSIAADLTLTGTDPSQITVTNGAFVLAETGNLSINNVEGALTVSTDELTLNAGDVTLADGAELAFDDVEGATINTHLNGGAGSSVTVNGSGNSEGVTLTLGDDLTWSIGSFTIDLGNGPDDSLQGNNIDSEWSLGADQSTLTQNERSVTLVGIEHLNGGEGSDRFVVADRGANVTVSGGAGVGDDRLQSPDGVNQWQLGEGNNHQLLMPGEDPDPSGEVTFSGIESILGATGTDQDTLAGPDTTTAWYIDSETGGTVVPGALEPTAALPDSDAAITFSGMNTLQGGVGDDHFHIGNSELGALVLNAGEAPEDDNSVVDTVYGFTDQNTTWAIAAEGTQSIGNIQLINFERLQGANAVDDTFRFEAGAAIDLQIAGGAGGIDQLDYSAIEDELNVELGGNLESVSGIENILGNDSGTLTILDDLPDGADAGDSDIWSNNWSLTEQNAGTVTLHRDGDANSVTFSAFPNLAGGQVADTFDFSAGFSVNTVDGGSREGGANVITGPDVDQTWNIDTNDVVSLAGLFSGASNIHQLQGGTGNDTFAYQSAQSQVGATGGAGDGVDTADFSAVTANLTVPLGQDAEAGFFGVEDVDTIIGNAGGEFWSRLERLGSGDTTWSVTAENAGTVILNGGESTAFEGFNQLFGGEDVDTFSMSADLTGTEAGIQGRGGNDVFELPGVLTLAVSGGAGDDQFQLYADSQLAGDLQGGEGADTLIGPAQNVLWQIAGTDEEPAVTAQLSDSEAVLLSGAQSVDILQGQTGNDRFLFTVGNSGVTARGGDGDGVDTVDYSQFAGNIDVPIGVDTREAFSGIEAFVGNYSADTEFMAQLFVADEVDADWVLNADGSGTVQTADAASATQFSGFNLLTGGAGNDQMLLQGPVSGIQFDGGAGGDSLSATGLAQNVWLLDQAQSYVGELDNPGAGNALGFVDVESLIGADGVADTFIVTATDNLPNMAAGAGDVTDTLDYSRIADALDISVSDDVAGDIERVVGNGGSILGANQPTTWQINEADGGILTDDNRTLAFANFTALQGGSQNDSFVLNAGIGHIDGGDGTNTLNATGFAADLHLTFNNATEHAVVLQEIDAVSAVGTFSNRLTGPTDDTTWTIDGVNAGEVAWDGNQVEFNGFNILAGVETNDFVLNDGGRLVIQSDEPAPGRVIGGAGQNSLQSLHDQASGEVTWQVSEEYGGTLNTGTPLLFTTIQDLLGGDAADTFQMSANGRVDSLGGGGGTNTLQGADVDAQWVVDGPFSGTYQTVDFADIQNLDGGSGADSVELQGAAQIAQLSTGGGNDTVELQAAAEVAQLFTGEGSDTVTFTGAASVDVLDAGATPEGGTDRLDLTGYGDGVRLALDQSAVADLQAVQFTDVLAPAIGDSALVAGQTTDNQWDITGVNSGSVNSVTFSGFGQLIGGEQADQFLFAEGGRIDNGVYGGGGLDRLSATSDDNQWRFTGSDEFELLREGAAQQAFSVESVTASAADEVFDFSSGGLLSGALEAGGGADEIIAPNQGNTWQITQNNVGRLNDVMDFTSVEHLTGGDAQDRFVFADGTTVFGLIDGGNPTSGADGDELVLTDYSQAFVIQLDGLAEQGDVPAFSIEGIEHIVTPDDHQGRLQAGDAANQWRITGENSGTLNGTAFTNFSSLNGGSEADRFELFAGGRLTGTADGRGGENRFEINDEFSADLQWQIDSTNAGSVSRIGEDGGVQSLAGFANVQTLVSGDGDDTLILADAGSIVEADLAGGLDRLQLGDAGREVTLTANEITISAGEQPSALVRRAESLLLSSGDDRLIVSGAVQVREVTDPGGYDTFDATDLQQALEVNLAAGETNVPMVGQQGGLSVDGVEVWQGNDALTNTLVGKDVDAQWRFTAVDAATVDSGPDHQGPSLWAFEGFSGITGGNQADQFMLNGHTPSVIRGGEGDNHLVFGAGTDAAWTIDGPDAGQLNVGDNNTVFSSMARLTGGAGADTFTFEEQGSISGYVDGGGGDADSLSFTHGSYDWFIGDNALAAPGLVQAKDSGDAVLSFAGMERVEAGEGSWLTAGNRNNTWSFNGPGSGVLRPSDGAESVGLEFAGFSAFIGGSEADDFILPDEDYVGEFIDGSAGADSLRVEAAGNSADFLNLALTRQQPSSYPGFEANLRAANLERVEVINREASIYGYNQAGNEYIWRIDGANQGLLSSVVDGEQASALRFIGFSHIFAGEGDDRFQMVDGGAIAQISGGEGDDWIDYSEQSGDLNLSLSRDIEAEGVGNLVGIEGVIGNNDGDDPENSNQATLTGMPGFGTWILNGTNSGVYADSSDVSVIFRGFNHLRGGNGDDRFVAQPGSRLTGSAVGGGHVNGDTFVIGDEWATDTPFHVAMLNREDGENGTRPTSIPAEAFALSDIESVTGHGGAAHLWGADANNLWQLDGQNQGQVSLDGGASMSFAGVGNLRGGSGDDLFELSGQTGVTGWISGGGGSDQVQLIARSVDGETLLVGDDLTRSVDVGSAVPARVLNDVEQVIGDLTADNILFADSANAVTWLLDGDNAGDVLGVNFSSFARLQGGESDDAFVVEADGVFDGLLHGGGGNNSVNLLAAERNLHVTLGQDSGADFHLRSIHSIVADSENLANTLTGPESTNIWNINALDAGAINEEITFSGFQTLLGGSLDDNFVFTEEGAVSTLIDGQGHETGDVANYSAIAARQVRVQLNDNLRNIERLVGGNQTRLVGPDLPGQAVNWQLDAVNNEGEVSFASTRMTFSGVANLQGGSANDRFITESGNAFTTLSGGGGNDVLSVQVNSAANNLQSSFDGGEGDDRIEFHGAGSGFVADYRGSVPVEESGPPNALPATMAFTEVSEGQNVEQSWTYLNSERVLQRALVDQTRINATSAEDQFVLDVSELGNTRVSVNAQAPLEFDANNQSLLLAANAADQVTLAGQVQLNGELIMQNGRVFAEDDTRLRVGSLLLDGVGLFGSAEAPIRTDIATLRLNNIASPVYLREENGLNLGAIDTRALLTVDLMAGSLRQNADTRIVADAISFHAENGDITLDKANTIRRVARLDASADIHLVNTVDTQVDVFKAEGAVFDISGDLISEGATTIGGDTEFNVSGNMALTGTGHDLSNITINRAASATIHDVNNMNLYASTVSNQLTLAAETVSVLGDVNVGGLDVTAAGGSVNINAPVNATSSPIVLNGTYISINERLTGISLDMQSLENSIVLAPLSMTANIDVVAGQATINAPVSAGGTNHWRTTNDLFVNAEVTAGSELILDSAQSTLNIGAEQALTAENVSLHGQDVNIIGSVEAGSVAVRSIEQTELTGELRATDGDISIEAGRYTADSGSVIRAESGNVSIVAESTLTSAGVDAQQNILLESTVEGQSLQGIVVNGTLTSATGDVILSAGENAITMNSDAVLHALDGGVLLSGGDMTLSTVRADGEPEMDPLGTEEPNPEKIDVDTSLGRIYIVSTGSVLDDRARDNHDASSAALRAYALDIEAQDGIGRSANALDTAVTSLMAENQDGDIFINNTGELYVRGLSTYGNIDLGNDTDVLVTNGSINALRGEPLSASYSPPSSGFHFQLEIPEPPGSLIMQGTPDPNNPAIAARSASILTSGGDFAGLGLPPSIYTPESLLIIAARSWSDPIWGFGRRPDSFTDNSIIKTNINDVGAGEQLVAVETLEEIDPAVFTAVRNYLYGDVSILLPRDQRYDLDEDDQEEAERFGF